MERHDRRSVAESVEGTSLGDFAAFDWGQMGLAAAIFGSAFLWIAISLRSIDPATIAFGRIVLGAAVLVLFPKARVRIGRAEWPRLFVAAFFGMAAPLYLFALAEERISSAVAGMLVSSAPIFAAILAALVTRSLPTRTRTVGLSVGLLGIILLSGPDLSDTGAGALGVGMVLVAVLCYAIASILYAPLQQAHGSLPVTMWLLMVAALMMAPSGLIGLRSSAAEFLPVLSLIILGMAGTGVAWAMFVSLTGRVGAVRAAAIGYIIPVAALLLGVIVLDESIEIVQVAGMLVALGGGYIVSRGREAPGHAPTLTTGDPDPA